MGWMGLRHRVLPAALVLALSAGCGGGNGSVAPSSVPALSNLHLSPSSGWQHEGGGEIGVQGTIDFTDADGDLATVRLTTTVGADITIPVVAPGLTSGTLVGSFVIPTSEVGEYGYAVWVIDAAGHSSNVIQGLFPVRTDDRGVAWVQRTTGTLARLNAVVSTGPGSLAVAVGEGGLILSSHDGGITWQPEVSGTDRSLRGVAWSGGRFAAVGEDGTLVWSDDGHAWSPATGGVPLHDLEDVAWSGTRFVAVGEAVLTDSLHVLTSPDGATWSAGEASFPGRELRAVTWSGNEFLAVGKQGATGTDSSLVVRSPDGLAWTRSVIGQDAALRDVLWTDGVYMAVGATGTLMRSTEGSSWEAVAAPSPDLAGLASSGATVVAVGFGVHASTDGAGWTQTLAQAGLEDVTWTGERFIAVGFAGTLLTAP